MSTLGSWLSSGVEYAKSASLQGGLAYVKSEADYYGVAPRSPLAKGAVGAVGLASSGAVLYVAIPLIGATALCLSALVITGYTGISAYRNGVIDLNERNLNVVTSNLAPSEATYKEARETFKIVDNYVKRRDLDQILNSRFEPDERSAALKILVDSKFHDLGYVNQQSFLKIFYQLTIGMESKQKLELLKNFKNEFVDAKDWTEIANHLLSLKFCLSKPTDRAKTLTEFNDILSIIKDLSPNKRKALPFIARLQIPVDQIKTCVETFEASSMTNDEKNRIIDLIIELKMSNKNKVEIAQFLLNMPEAERGAFLRLIETHIRPLKSDTLKTALLTPKVLAVLQHKKSDEFKSFIEQAQQLTQGIQKVDEIVKTIEYLEQIPSDKRPAYIVEVEKEPEATTERFKAVETISPIWLPGGGMITAFEKTVIKRLGLENNPKTRAEIRSIYTEALKHGVGQEMQLLIDIESFISFSPFMKQKEKLEMIKHLAVIPSNQRMAAKKLFSPIASFPGKLEILKAFAQPVPVEATDMGDFTAQALALIDRGISSRGLSSKDRSTIIQRLANLTESERKEFVKNADDIKKDKDFVIIKVETRYTAAKEVIAARYTDLANAAGEVAAEAEAELLANKTELEHAIARQKVFELLGTEEQKRIAGEEVTLLTNATPLLKEKLTAAKNEVIAHNQAKAESRADRQKAQASDDGVKAKEKTKSASLAAKTAQEVIPAATEKATKEAASMVKSLETMKNTQLRQALLAKEAFTKVNEYVETCIQSNKSGDITKEQLAAAKHKKEVFIQQESVARELAKTFAALERATKEALNPANDVFTLLEANYARMSKTASLPGLVEEAIRAVELEEKAAYELSKPMAFHDKIRYTRILNDAASATNSILDRIEEIGNRD